MQLEDGVDSNWKTQLFKKELIQIGKSSRRTPSLQEGVDSNWKM